VIGIVLVSHSARVAEGAAELGREMGGSGVAIEPAGGLDEPDRPIGTDAALIARAIERASSGDGVLVLMDLGSALMSAEMASEMVDRDDIEVLLCAAPLVEGAVAAAASARTGAALQEVAAEASRALDAKAAHLGAEPPGSPAPAPALDEGSAHELRLRVDNPMGLHARPAARFVQTAARFDAEVSVTNLSRNRGPARADSLSAVATLGAGQGDEIGVRAAGPQAQAALEALSQLARERFGDAPSPGDAVPAGPSRPRRAEIAEGTRLEGLPAAPGIGVGPVVQLAAREPVVADEPQGEPGGEWELLETALKGTRERLHEAQQAVASRVGPDEADILAAQLLLLDDDELLGPARRSVFEQRTSAARAWKDATDAVKQAYDGLEDDYQRARGEDLADLQRRVLLELEGEGAAPISPREGVLVAHDVGPADVAALDERRVVAVVVAAGGPTSHAAILARAAGIPAVVGAGPDVLSIPEGTVVGVDGEAGTIEIAPKPERARELERLRRAWLEERQTARSRAAAPAATRDGVEVAVLANAGSVEDAVHAVEAGADGIGLLRTEFLFLGRDTVPAEDEQYDAYRRVAEILGGRPLVLRTLDAGADKPLRFLSQAREDNPYLGVRGIRLLLDRPDVLEPQLRAALRVAADHPLKLMFPMVSSLAELLRARELLDGCGRALAGGGARAGRPRVGVMVEVPAAALQAGAWAAEVDFFSLGTNDLAQYAMAADRGNARVAALADATHPAVLELVAMTCRAAAQRDRTVSVCGELAGDLDATAILVGLGVRELSVSPPSVPAVKQAVRGLEARAATALATRALRAPGAAEVRALARAARAASPHPRES
jgi:phosphoenolpyruvate-protein phosphotransferase/dihydroxyacetone kinase phosphotransfer subunit